MKDKIIFYSLFICLTLATIITYSNHFHNSFHFDDDHTIVNNIYIRDIKNIPLFFRDAKTTSSLPANQAYRPGLTTLNTIDFWLSKKQIPESTTFHISIFITYLLLGFALFFLLLNLFNYAIKHQWNKYFALFAVAWFWLHTSNAETVNYIIQRAEIYSTLAIVLCFLIYIYTPKLKKYHFYIIPFIIGYFIKEPVLMFAPLLFLYILFFENNLSLGQITATKNKKVLSKALITIIPLLIIGSILFLLSKKMTPTTWTPGGVSPINYLLTETFVIVHYFNSFFLPFNLSADTDWQPISNIFDDKVIAGLFFIFLLLTIAFYYSKKQVTRPISFGILWFFIALIPTSSIFPFAEVLNDHRPFFPYIGLFISVVWLVSYYIIKFEKKIKDQVILKTSIVAIALLVLGSHAFGTHQRNKVWNNDESLWYDVTIKSPKNGRGLMNYGLTQMRQAKYNIALKYFEDALIYNPYYSYLHINIGIVKNVLNKVQEAEEHFKKAIQYAPNYYGSYYFYGQFLNSHNRQMEAMLYLEKAVELGPSNMDVRYLLMSNYNDLGEWQKLQETANKTLQLMPNDLTALKYLDASRNKKSKLDIQIENAKSNPSPENYLNLSLYYYQNAQYEKCVEAANDALKLKPNYDLAYNNICCAYNMLKQFDKAIEAGENAVKSNPASQLAKNNLAEARRLKSKQTKNK